MAVGEMGPAVSEPAAIGRADRRPGTKQAQQAQQWLLTLLPAFPVLLLVLRLWRLSRQDMPTMLLLVQYVSPLGLLSALLIALVWAFPLVVLVLTVLGRLLQVSAPDRFDPDRSLLAYGTVRTPGWVLVAAIALAALTWQLRFLPLLMMLALWLLALRTRLRYPDRPRLLLVTTLLLPVVAATASYAWLAPAVPAAIRDGELATALLLVVPPLGAVVLTGPVPRPVAPALTHSLAYAVAAVVPLVTGVVFLRVPLLPAVAVEVGPETGPVREVVRGQAVTVTDRMTIVLDGRGEVRFLPNDQVRGQLLCPDPGRIPVTRVDVYGWHVEETALDWMIPRQPVGRADPRCLGRVPAGDPTEPSAPPSPGPAGSSAPPSSRPR
ncbi:hypothetical protein RM555_16620 [Micromonospora sp. DSM 115977]|uniref:Integral membrane protein n=1 Tax=Micromonospora reichwaldensis TaxID=3075516 RepID=A0ABU2WYQ1_9ACTN|nr:hypothetical protein [Micromonospora sp. DSM 115977]MDT0530618.1 hypothetical protein [Micromonospora sp. DSM 115977]